jgi:enamine deaminase RidA (YjgF/YER057c/UK114 family)
MGDEIAMAVKIDRIQPAGVNVRMQQGKPAYSHVVTVTGPAKMIYIAGQLARDADGNIVGPGDMRAQLEQTFKNLDACLKAAGATWADVVKTNTFVTDYPAFSQCSDVRMRYFGVGKSDQHDDPDQRPRSARSDGRDRDDRGRGLVARAQSTVCFLAPRAEGTTAPPSRSSSSRPPPTPPPDPERPAKPHLPDEAAIFGALSAVLS